MATYIELQKEVLDRLNLTSTDDGARIGRAINRVYRKVTSAIGLQTTRRQTIQATITSGTHIAVFDCEKIINVVDRNLSKYKTLSEVTLDELQANEPYAATVPTLYAIQSQTADTVTISVNAVPQTSYVLYADAHVNLAVLNGSQVPVIPESFHDIIIEGVLADEYKKLEKPAFSKDSRAEYEDRLSDLKMWMALSNSKEIFQGKLDTSTTSGGGSGSGGGGVNGALSYTQTGLITFDRSSLGAGTPPFAIVAGAGNVDNLDADFLDGLDSTAFALAGATPALHAPTHKSGGTDPIKLDELAAPTDVVTLNASTTAHGLLKKLSNAATDFMDGTGAWDTVKDSDLSTSDITTNDVTTAKHGLVPKAPNDTTKALLGNATWAIPANPEVCNGRLTLTTALPITTADVAAAGTIFFTPYLGNRISTYSGTVWTTSTFTEKSLTVPAVGNQMYDVFIVDSTLALEALAWTNDTTRATAITLQDGVYVKSGATTRRYLGSFRTLTASQTEDSFTKRLLWNYYNRVKRPMRVIEGSDTWTYSTAAFHQVNASAANQVACVMGVAEGMIEAECCGVATNNSGIRTFISVSIGEDSTTTPVAGILMESQQCDATTAYSSCSATLRKFVPLGYHFYAWLEYSGANATTTWNGDSGVAYLQTGLTGSIDA